VRACRAGAAELDVEALLTSHEGIRWHLVPALLAVYIDIEYTDRGNQFYEKFNMRHSIAELLVWLWEVPQHRTNWERIGASLLHLCPGF
jgi:Ubiquitin elongating factor core